MAGQDIHWVGDNQENRIGGIRFDMRQNVIQNPDVASGERQTAFAFELIGTRTDHHDGGAGHILPSSAADFLRSGKRHTVTDVHSLTLSASFVDVNQNEFFEQNILHQRVCTGGADKPRTDDRAFIVFHKKPPSVYMFSEGSMPKQSGFYAGGEKVSAVCS